MNKSQRTNVDKIRRHMARSTPDIIQKRFNPIKDDDCEAKCAKWLERFRVKMLIKHGKNTRIDVYTEEHDKIYFITGDTLVTAVAVCINEKEEKQRKIGLENFHQSVLIAKTKWSSTKKTKEDS